MPLIGDIEGKSKKKSDTDKGTKQKVLLSCDKSDPQCPCCKKKQITPLTIAYFLLKSPLNKNRSSYRNEAYATVVSKKDTDRKTAQKRLNAKSVIKCTLHPSTVQLNLKNRIKMREKKINHSFLLQGAIPRQHVLPFL